jgi:hypothetical protein
MSATRYVTTSHLRHDISVRGDDTISWRKTYLVTTSPPVPPQREKYYTRARIRAHAHMGFSRICRDRW